MSAPRPAVARTAIVSAMAQELAGLLALVEGAETVQRGRRRFVLGRLDGHEVVLVLSGIGKVAAATTATLLLSEFGVRRLLFTGVAGGVGPAVRVGDIVVADALLQHDMNASPLFPRFEMPLYGLDRFAADPLLADAAGAAALWALADTGAAAGAGEGEGEAAQRVHRGLVVSGDTFVCSGAACRALQADLPQALAVEMEGAALAQVCHDLGAPFAVVRTVSDRADDDAHVDFERFIAERASRYSVAIARRWLAALPPA
ncbi:MAG TPA: 5'-methylthioadenosine/adenosylhomocysteine nucleosidase [Ideonella sp.]|nr:5'-methylthioadenosine/adenosylhomocysteine nucleosidase [Ideonella sp.]